MKKTLIALGTIMAAIVIAGCDSQQSETGKDCSCCCGTEMCPTGKDCSCCCGTEMCPTDNK